MKPRVLYVEDQQWDMGGVIRNLEMDFEVMTVRSAEEALQALEKDSDSITLILLDIRLITPTNRTVYSAQGRRAGVELARTVRQKYDIPIVCYTANLHPDINQELIDIGVVELVEKGGSIRDLKARMWKHIHV
jgi:CheY-like chemotaxis protein